MALNVGSRLGHYSVTALIGDGGMGEVTQPQPVLPIKFEGQVVGESRSSLRNCTPLR
jgi:hypothetical protein